MDKEKKFQEFTEIVAKIYKLSTFQQFGEYPKQISNFLEEIYQEGYATGYIDGIKNKELKQSKQN